MPKNILTKLRIRYKLGVVKKRMLFGRMKRFIPSNMTWAGTGMCSITSKSTTMSNPSSNLAVSGCSKLRLTEL